MVNEWLVIVPSLFRQLVEIGCMAPFPPVYSSLAKAFYLIFCFINFSDLSVRFFYSLPPSDSRWTQQVILDVSSHPQKLAYLPGDHLAVLPANKADLVSAIIDRLQGVEDPHKPVTLMTLKEITTLNGESEK